jgi:hypothetical protein
VRQWVHLKRPLFILSVFLVSAEISLAAELRRETIDAFERYIASTEAQLEPRFRGDHFLWPDESPQLKEQLLHGSIVVKPSQGNGIVTIKGGLIEDWMGVVFIPNAHLKTVLSTVQDYDHHGEIYKPDIADAKIQTHVGNDFLVYMRLVKAKFFLADVLNSEHEIQFIPLDSTRVYSHSRSKRIAEVSEAGKPSEHELPVGQDRGLLWRMNGYWFFEEKDAGVYVSCQSVTLTRDIPFVMAKLLSPIIHELPAEQVRNALEKTRKAIVSAVDAKP